MARLFYVSAIDGPRFTFLAGPFKTHEEALSAVDRAKWAANAADPRAHWYAYGTAQAPEGYAQPGVLNDVLAEEE